MITLEGCGQNSMRLKHQNSINYYFMVWILQDYQVVDVPLKCFKNEKECEILSPDSIITWANFTKLVFKKIEHQSTQIAFAVFYNLPNRNLPLLDTIIDLSILLNLQKTTIPSATSCSVNFTYEHTNT
ncbi:hypothetical protein RF11_07304 [Thelohanellus kitauei]|uniref:Uncharacterized protein n=1 Tax=Thelohanellus kitauei TaxID=669202 RepID=A0A0C2MKR6_THEKT|nr:hypothetical protein RF11_07304 [Thelohanellus kitauei]